MGSRECGLQYLCTGQVPCGMWNLPGAGIEPVSPVLAGRFRNVICKELPYWFQENIDLYNWAGVSAVEGFGRFIMQIHNAVRGKRPKGREDFCLIFFFSCYKIWILFHLRSMGVYCWVNMVVWCLTFKETAKLFFHSGYTILQVKTKNLKHFLINTCISNSKVCFLVLIVYNILRIMKICYLI